MDFVLMEGWHGGLAMGYLWSRIVYQSSSEDIAELSKSSVFAETLASFSTISQEKRHETLPSWYFPRLANLGCLRKRLCVKCGDVDMSYFSLH
jgi:hypothetical protein